VEAAGGTDDLADGRSTGRPRGGRQDQTGGGARQRSGWYAPLMRKPRGRDTRDGGSGIPVATAWWVVVRHNNCSPVVIDVALPSSAGGWGRRGRWRGLERKRQSSGGVQPAVKPIVATNRRRGGLESSTTKRANGLVALVARNSTQTRNSARRFALPPDCLDQGDLAAPRGDLSARGSNRRQGARQKRWAARLMTGDAIVLGRLRPVARGGGAALLGATARPPGQRQGGNVGTSET